MTTIDLVEDSRHAVRVYQTDSWVRVMDTKLSNLVALPMSAQVPLARALGDLRVRDGLLHHIVNTYENGMQEFPAVQLVDHMYRIRFIREGVDRFLSTTDDLVSMAPLHTIEAVCHWMLGQITQAQESLDLAFEHEDQYRLALMMAFAIETGIPCQFFIESVTSLSADECTKGVN